MIVLGVILLLVGWLGAIHILLILGIILAVVGLCVEGYGTGTHRPIGGRRWY